MNGEKAYGMRVTGTSRNVRSEALKPRRPPSLAEGCDIYGRRQGDQQNATQSDRPDDKISHSKSARPCDCFLL